MAGVTTQEQQEQKSHELGMHTEALSGRTQQVFFDMEKLEEGGFGYHDAPDVDFNKRAEFDAADMDSALKSTVRSAS